MKLFNKKQLTVGITCLTLALVAVTPGCKKFLDTDIQGGYTADNYPYPSGSGPYDVYINAIYGDLRSYNVHADGFIVATSIRSDDADKGSTASDGGSDVITMDNFPVLPNNGRGNALWTGYYGMITKCNTALDAIANNTNIVADPAVKAQAEAEVRFVRGYAYFMLVRLFGNVPLIDKVFADPAAQSNVAQSSPDVIYPFIEKDLTVAAAGLPMVPPAKFPGRLTAGAANGMLAKVYLTQKKWGAAMGVASAVINSGQYDLSTPYAKIFSEDGENSKESIFEVQATASSSRKTEDGIQYASIQGVRGVNDFNMGWGWNTPSPFLEAAYEANDPRKARTILYASKAGAQSRTLYNEIMPLYPSEVPNERYNNKVYTNPSFRSAVNDRGGWWMNVRILRYADVVLMYAEAANETGATQEAIDKLEMVRARARAGNAAILPKVTTTDKTGLRLAIQQERRIELAMEHDRFFDLVRWGIADDALHAAGKANYLNSRDALLPIPQTQIDLSKNVLKQNPGY
ncbi:RagB/SusD family nutrient uptake outer membrane protein [Pedobacter duraquae]|uniref:Putative outer membrane starch-binding protein n=1 Tax=Pedobacter duraquae TaxID=425511 RepID=A0A4V3C2Y8_9SPHI|nr:RagB/SusD family nutrient uptake outer membrane protein [Pedobacter duraquae]TDO19719.1 putative outer membrane starch-binding protein [Pedobacter duraquae]